MTLWAVSDFKLPQPPTFYGISHIVKMVSSIEMLWINARWVVTGMKNVYSIY